MFENWFVNICIVDGNMPCLLFANDEENTFLTLHRLCIPTPEEKDSEVTQACPTLCDSMDCSLPGSSIHGIFWARILEWVIISFSRGSSQPRDWTWVFHIASKLFTIWATRESLLPTSEPRCLFLHCPHMLATSYLWLSNTWNETGMAEEKNFYILTKLKTTCGDFPADPVVKTLLFCNRGHGLHLWTGN